MILKLESGTTVKWIYVDEVTIEGDSLHYVFKDAVSMILISHYDRVVLNDINGILYEKHKVGE